MATTTRTRPAEEHAIHTRMLRMGLAEEDSRCYWDHAQRGLPEADRVRVAFEERWFGSRSMARVRYLMVNFAHRFDALPEALQVLSCWRPSDPQDRRLLCHWHVQFSDPLYREFTGSVMQARRHHPSPAVDRLSAIRFVEGKTEGRWGASTCQRMAAGLLSCAAEAGLCQGVAAVRPLLRPRVSDQAFGYLLHLLREVQFEGSLRDNPYMHSVGLDSEHWHERVRRLPWVQLLGLADVVELSWEYPDLRSWARGALGV